MNKLDGIPDIQESKKDPIENLSYKEIRDKIKEEFPDCHIGYVLQLVQDWKIDPEDKKYYYNALRKAATKKACKIDNNPVSINWHTENKIKAPVICKFCGLDLDEHGLCNCYEHKQWQKELKGEIESNFDDYKSKQYKS